MRRIIRGLLVALLALLPMAVLAQGGTLVTGFQVQNLGGTPASITIRYIDANGATAATQTDTIPGNASKTYFGSTMSVGAGFRGSVVIESNVPVAAVTNVLNTTNNTAGTYNGVSSTLSSTTVNLPLIFRNNGGANTYFFVQNAGTGTANVTITYFFPGGPAAGVTETTTIAEGASKEFRQGGAAGTQGRPAGLPDTFVGSARVSGGSTPLAVVVNQENNTTTDPKLLLSYDGFGTNAAATSIAIPLVLGNNFGAYTGIQVQNTGATADVTIAFTPNTATVAPAGRSVCTFGNQTRTPASRTQSIAAGQSFTFLQNSQGGDPQFNGCTYIGSATVSSSSPLVAIANQVQFAAGTAASPNAASVYESFNPASVTGSVNIPLVQANNFGAFSGIQIQNTSATAGQFTITYGPNTATLSGRPAGTTLCGTPAPRNVTIAANGSNTQLQTGGSTPDRDPQFASCVYVGSASVTAPTNARAAVIVNQLQPGFNEILTTYSGFNQ